MGKLSDPSIQIDDVVQTIETDPAMCYRLLKYINSSAGGLTHSVDSLRAAIVHIGLRRLRSFSAFTAFASNEDARPVQLIVTALTRGRMCELISIAQGSNQSDMFFLAGLFSMLDALLDQSMPLALNAVPLAEPITMAILNAEGPLADVLMCVLNYEKGNFDAVSLPGVTADRIRSTYIDAISWARNSTDVLSELT